MKRKLAPLALLAVLFSLLTLSSSCRARNESAVEEEAPPEATSESPPPDPALPPSDDQAMGTDLGTLPDTGEIHPPPPPPTDKVLVSEEEVAKNFPQYKPSTGKKVRVFYATDRRPTGSENPDTYFGPEPSPDGQLHWGTCEVSIPHKREIGSVPGVGGSIRAENPNIHIVLLNLRPLSKKSFFSQLQPAVQGSKKQELLVFVHGYNVKFKDAVRRTAQLAADLEFKGIPVTYSWPSNGSVTKENTSRTSTGHAGRSHTWKAFWSISPTSREPHRFTSSPTAWVRRP